MGLKKNTIPIPLKPHMKQLQKLCKSHHIKRLWVFGSVVNNNLNPDSDIDFLYELDRESINESDFLANFFGFYDALKILFKREIDLIKYKAIANPYFLAEIDETKVKIYDKKSTSVFV